MSEAYYSKRLLALRFLSCTLVYALMLGSVAQAAPDPSVIEVYDTRTRKIIACKKVAGKWEAGNRVRPGKKFVSYREVILELKSKLKLPTTTREYKKRITRNLSTLVANMPAQRRLCKQAASQQPQPTPTPSGTASPVATATPTPGGCSQSCYNNSRLTPCFHIPSGMLGNESSGQQLWATCAGCHVESTRRNRSFSSIVTAFSTVPEMMPFAPSFDNQDVADIAAYLNRYNPKQCRTDWP